MSYNPNTGIVQDTGANDGVSVMDVQRALGVSSGDEGTLCRHGNIRSLSPYKPVRGNLNGQADKPGVMSVRDLMYRNLGFDIPVVTPGSEANFKSLIFGIINGSYQWPTAPGQNYDDYHGGIGNGWFYPNLRENTDFARITDFNGYNNRCANKYENTTFEILEGSKIVVQGSSISYTGNFFVRMDTLNPRNFASLFGYNLGVAFVSADVLASGVNGSGTVYYYIGSNDAQVNPYGTIGTPSTFNGMLSDQVSLSMPSNVFNALINKSISGETIYYCVGFFAPNTYAGKTNITGTTYSSRDLHDLIPLPGLGYDTFTCLPASSTANYLQFTCSGSIMKPATVEANFSLISVTNEYPYTTPFNLYMSRLKYTFVAYDSGGQPVKTQDQMMSFTYKSGQQVIPRTDVIDVSNETAGVHKRTALSINQTFNLDNKGQAEEGGWIMVKLWYPTGVTNADIPETTDRLFAGETRITIGDPEKFSEVD